MACSYGFGVLPISCRQRRLKDILPNTKNLCKLNESWKNIVIQNGKLLQAMENEKYYFCGEKMKMKSIITQ
jgi:hypothetical protein